MAYLDDDFEAWDDEAVITLPESNGNGGWESAGFGEAVGPKYRRQYKGGVRRTVPPRPSAPRPVGALGGVTLNTPAGRAQVRFEKPLATKESVDELAKELKRDVATVTEAIKRIDQVIDTNTSMLDKKVGALEGIMKRGQQGSQMSMLLPLLLTQPPQIDKLTVKEGTGSRDLAVSNTAYRKDDNFGTLLMVMALSGGFGGGGSGNDAMMPLMLLAVSGGFGK